ncbi:hypothetical protein D1781_12500 [Amnibacterium setariae]|uniref:Uncharacterized protein n=2 Tax=Amnibacterium setariae TaxID=2306585 RepID=A0A3A1TWW0_9MICO|nr:hypothetical protein D1781_12500 [Amnibacterium setariae]
MDDEEREALRQELLRDHPDLDLENLLMGELAGPASPDRPDLPVWEYRAFVRDHPGADPATLAAIRFPVRYAEGTSGVTSIAEQLKPYPRSFRGRVPEPVVVIDADAIARRYEMEHEAGLQEWDHDARGIVRLQPLAAWREVTRAWFDTLERTAH